RLNSYRINQNPAYLERVERHAVRLMENSVEVGDASFLPYPFDFAIHGREMLPAPWYSGMAQGQALSAFTRLYNVTGNETYKDFADRLFASLTQHKNADDPNIPWVTQVDTDGYLWFEEYAKGDYADYTYNGHMYAVIGLYEYYLAFENPIALDLYQGGMTTIRHYADEIRNPGDISSYCLRHPDVKSASYHEVHIREFRLFARMTGDTTFTYLADLFRQDYTPPTL
ncbi:MAG: D-glucuronyl C5-epimerase family protein, partial [Dietzia sp.]|nr:D-glucuronyl C5-epimerase family protein [Dietzia sp.]